MINKNDEYLHEPKKTKDWTESFNINFVSKKNKVYGSVDFEFLFGKRKIQTHWVIIYNNTVYENSELVDFNGKFNAKKYGNSKFEYSIVTPLKSFRLSLKNESITAAISISGIYPIFDFPANIYDEELSDVKIPVKTWNKYEQRCKINGTLQIKSGENKGRKVNFDCFGQREHLWGNVSYDDLYARNRITVQFRDMSMNLSYQERNTVPESNGFISKRSGNIPIVNVEYESIHMDIKKAGIVSSEFSYKDAQDDVDLLVGKSLFSVAMPLTAAKKKKYFHFRTFAEFTIIGTNKKGYGVEEHLFYKDLPEPLESTD
ncbi:MAG: hypothetical protein JW864_05990 [Spirochaetes bacterium]|nr:hypothetical protein [Spirochaetota bacterium]